jgi:hypothetical protein
VADEGEAHATIIARLRTMNMNVMFQNSGQETGDIGIGIDRSASALTYRHRHRYIGIKVGRSNAGAGREVIGK